MSIASGLRTFFKLRQERHDSGADDLPASSMPLLTELGVGSKRGLTMNMALLTELVAASMREAKHLRFLGCVGRALSSGADRSAHNQNCCTATHCFQFSDSHFALETRL